jgi:hypothetical protein
MANLIRLKQLDQAELSGYIQEISARVGAGNGGNYIINTYDYFTGNFNISSSYINLASPSGQVTGVLPEIIDGLRYHIKNINTGIVFISGNNTIDSIDTFTLLENESVELLGVKNIYHTGWLTMISNPGL